MKKIISIILIFGLITSQIGCGGKKVNATLDEAHFDPKYVYYITLKNGEKIWSVPADQIDKKQDQIVLKSSNENKSIMNYEIKKINGVTKRRTGSHAKTGAIVGAGIAMLPGLIIGGVVGGLEDDGLEGFCEDEPCTNDNDNPIDGILIGALIGGVVGVLGGALIGGSIGAIIPKHDRIQITPIVNPTTSGFDAGVNVGIKF